MRRTNANDTNKQIRAKHKGFFMSRKNRKSTNVANNNVANNDTTMTTNVANNDVVDNETRINELLNELRTKPPLNKQKSIRRKLRALNHRGGLRTNRNQ